MSSSYTPVVLTNEQKRRLESIEGNGYGTGVLPELIDKALQGGSASSAAAAAQATANAALPAAKLVKRSGTVPAGSASPIAAVSGLLTTDTILAVTQQTKNANSLPIVGSAAACTVANQLQLSYSADPGASGTIAVLVLTA